MTSRSERGSVTVEFAAVLPLTLVLMTGCGWIAALGIDQLRCVDAARLGARAGVAQPDPRLAVLAARSAAQQAAPDGSVIRVELPAGAAGSRRLTVSVRYRFGAPGDLGALTSRGVASVELEPG